MSEGRKTLAAILRDCAQEIKACGPRAEMYNQHQEDGRPHPIGAHGLNFGSAQWHLGFAAGIQWAQMRMEWALMGTRPGGAPYPDVPLEQPAADSKTANFGLTIAIQHLNSSPYSLTKDECIELLRKVRDGGKS